MLCHRPAAVGHRTRGPCSRTGQRTEQSGLSLTSHPAVTNMVHLVVASRSPQHPRRGMATLLPWGTRRELPSDEATPFSVGCLTCGFARVHLKAPLGYSIHDIMVEGQAVC